MKKNTSFLSDLFIFLVILFFFLIPPFFAPQISENNSPFLAWHFPSRQLIYALFAFSLYFFYRNRVFSYEKRTINKIFRFPLIFTFSILFFIQLIFKVISISDNYFSQNQNTIIPQINVLLPDSFITWLFCILNFLFSAFFEEVIYRFYLPMSLHSFFSQKSQENKAVFVIIEIVCCLLFAFSHLYLGFLSVLNAFFAHIVLRSSFFVSRNIYCNTAAHFLYNVISLILL
ncbi:MAG: CPBP family intramembrane glutamic endopeptidase [Treponema sp.]|nr:CPBP family intramembrane metalloprotease [Spirochaetales bacterium]MDY6191264.1 CPBP family intramembrane glutamic endopeptidase [Treponema sp.]